MIARVWKGTVHTENAPAYCAYVQETGIEQYEATEGNRGAWLMTKARGELTEIVTLSFWDSEQAIVAFAGTDISEAQFYPEDEFYLVDWGRTVEHYSLT